MSTVAQRGCARKSKVKLGPGGNWGRRLPSSRIPYPPAPCLTRVHRAPHVFHRGPPGDTLSIQDTASVMQFRMISSYAGSGRAHRVARRKELLM
jgi:hypothetical protein